MKLKTSITAFTLLSVIAFGAIASDAISRNQAKSRESMGIISLSAVNSSPMDLRAALNKKADAMGASAYHIIGVREGNNWRVTAQLYK